MRVLLAEQNVLTTKLTCKLLSDAGFIVDCYDRGDDVVEMVRHFEYDILLLDAALPVIGGVDVLRQMRRARYDAPVVILTADPDPSCKTEAFSAGADDVVALPVDRTELVARLQAIARRNRGLTSPVVRIAGLEVNLNTQEVTHGDRTIHLTGKEFSVLQLLILRRGTVLTKDAFLNHLYGGMDEPEMKIVDVFICKLRRKLQLAGVTDLIVTVWGRGYMLREDRSEAITVPQASPAVTARVRHFVAV